MCGGGRAVVVEVKVPQALRGLPDLHPQAIGGTELLWLEPGDPRIHQTEPGPPLIRLPPGLPRITPVPLSPPLQRVSSVPNNGPLSNVTAL